MQLVELLQYIECGGDGYFTYIFPFFFTCTSLPHFSIFCLLVQVACLKHFEQCSLFGLLQRSASSISILKLLSTYWARTNESVGFLISLSRAHMTLFYVRILPLPHIHSLIYTISKLLVSLSYSPLDHNHLLLFYFIYIYIYILIFNHHWKQRKFT